ncbi:MAG TPA: HDIG domain-containing protein [Patescibacteria group bacterium]|jgi:putative nucleotidyltransferase with HDIG domain|nr:HDIG domain-containing protein [Patescibacteria group bacterium]
MNRESAIQLLNEHITNQNLIRHNVAVGFIMRSLASKFGHNEDDWELAGMLHDLDWEETKDDFKNHTKVSKAILEKTDLKPEIINAIYVHNWVHEIKPETLLEKTLYCVEELSGLITAAALVQPDKRLVSVTTQSVLKKFKSKGFAAGVNREIILLCKDYINMELPELVEISLNAMKEHATEIGL